MAAAASPASVPVPRARPLQQPGCSRQHMSALHCHQLRLGRVWSTLHETSCPQDCLACIFWSASRGAPCPAPCRYLNVSGDSGADRQVFYSFTESERQPRKDPLVLWLQGCARRRGILLVGWVLQCALLQTLLGGLATEGSCVMAQLRSSFCSLHECHADAPLPCRTQRPLRCFLARLPTGMLCTSLCPLLSTGGPAARPSAPAASSCWAPSSSDRIIRTPTARSW